MEGAGNNTSGREGAAWVPRADGREGPPELLITAVVRFV